jgi:hypothetical protein
MLGEGPGGVLVTGDRERIEEMGTGSTRVVVLGEVGSERIEVAAGDVSASVALADAERAWRSLVERIEGAVRTA